MDSHLPVSGADKESPPSSKWRKRLGRALDVAAVLVVAFALYRFLVAPRLFTAKPVPAPTVELAAMDGGRFSLAAHRGRVVFLDFWASWCEPCKLSLPLVERYARAHPEADVVAVDVGEREEIARSFARERDMHGVVFDPREEAANAFGVSGFPTMIVVDPHGLERARWTGFNPAIEAAMGNAQATFSRVLQ